VKAMFATAFEEGVLRRDPAAGVRVAIPRPVFDATGDDVERVKALSVDELAALVAAIEENDAWCHWLLFVQFLADTGLRFGEAVELRWSDVDLGSRRLSVRRAYRDTEDGVAAVVDLPKSKYARRTLSLTPTMSRELWELRKRTRAGDGGLVFTGPRGGRVPYGSTLETLKEAGRQAGVGELGFHWLRHTCGTALFKEGWNAVQVQLWLGHHSPAFTLARYVHLLPDDTPDAVAIGTRPVTSAGTRARRDVPRASEAMDAESAAHRA